MNGLKYLVIASVLLVIPSLSVAKAKVVPADKEVMAESYDMAPMSVPDCKLVTPVLKAGEICTSVDESCPPSSFDICKTFRTRQHFTIDGGCRKECFKTDEYGKTEIVPCGTCCKPACKPACKKSCHKERCHKARCCK